MKHQRLFIIISCFAWVCGCSDTLHKSEGPKDVSISIHFLSSCSVDSVHMYTSDNIHLYPLMSAPVSKKEGKYSATLTGVIPNRGFYFIGTDEENSAPFIIDGNESIKLLGNCERFADRMKVMNSPLNQDYKAIKQRFGSLMTRGEQVANQYPYKGDKRQLSFFSRSKKVNTPAELVDSVKKANPYLGKVIGLEVFPRFDPKNNPNNYPNAFVYYAKEYFKQNDISDIDYAYIPRFYNKIQQYTYRLFSGDMMPEHEAEQYLQALLKSIPAEDDVCKGAWLNALQTLDKQKLADDKLRKYVQWTLKRYPDAPLPEHLEHLTLVRKAVSLSPQLERGSTAPPIFLPNPEGEIVGLKDFKGNITLVTFWASWSEGSRENHPALAELYNSYHSQGFEILSISLDDVADEWKAAISQDSMTWQHASELKRWGSKICKEYQVNQLPVNYLLNEDGIIIGVDVDINELQSKLKNLYLGKQ